MKIIPAILTDNSDDFKLKLRQAEEVCDFAQIDVMDGRFVPSKSVGIDTLSSIDAKIGLEFHLMVDDPLEYMEAAVKSKIKRIIFHFEAQKVPHQKIIAQIRRQKMLVGLAINPGTEIDQARHLFKEIDLFLFLAVNPGYYGSPFIPAVLDKVRVLAAAKHNFLIALDGGVKLDNISDIKNAGVEIACVGSAIFKGDAQDNYRRLKEQAGA